MKKKYGELLEAKLVSLEQESTAKKKFDISNFKRMAKKVKDTFSEEDDYNNIQYR
jgi:hypothetical protein